MSDIIPQKRCNKCGKEQSLLLYTKHSRRRDGLSTQCKECDRAYRFDHSDNIRTKDRRWAEANPDYFKNWRKTHFQKCRQYRRDSIADAKRSAQWRLAHPDKIRVYRSNRRARQAGAGGRGITAADMQAMIYCQQGLCAYCERDGQKLTLDHIIPLTQNGPHDPDNCCMACGVCNSSKKDRTPEQWEESGRWFDRITGR